MHATDVRSIKSVENSRPVSDLGLVRNSHAKNLVADFLGACLDVLKGCLDNQAITKTFRFRKVANMLRRFASLKPAAAYAVAADTHGGGKGGLAVFHWGSFQDN